MIYKDKEMTESSSLFSFYFISFSPKTRATVFPLLYRYRPALKFYSINIDSIMFNSLPACVVL